MKAQELYVKNGDQFSPTGKFFCTACRMISITKGLAEACCVCETCKVKPRALHKIYCTECLEKYYAKMESEEKTKRQVLFDAAQEVTEYEFVWWGEACVPDVKDILDDVMYGDLKDVPEFVFAMKPVKFSGFDVSKLFDDFDESEMCEGLCCKEVLTGCDILEEEIKVFNHMNKDRPIFWQEDTTRKVRVPVTEDESE